VKAFFVLWLKDQGLSISAFNQYRILPCLPSNEVDMPLGIKKQQNIITLATLKKKQQKGVSH